MKANHERETADGRMAVVPWYRFTVRSPAEAGTMPDGLWPDRPTSVHGSGPPAAGKRASADRYCTDWYLPEQQSAGASEDRGRPCGERSEDAHG